MTSEADNEEGLGAEERSLMFAGKDDKGGDYYEVMILQKMRRSLSIMMLTVIRDVYQKKNGKMWEFFPSGGPPPSPLFGNDMFFFSKKLWFILHFRTLGTFLVFIKMFTFGWYYGL